MTETEPSAIDSAQILETLRSLPWCRQGQSTLVAVYKCTPEIIELMRGHEVKVFPGGVIVKMNKSLLHTFQEKFDEQQPLPVVLVWKPEGLEIWYRRHKSEQFPYDTWTDSSAAAYERERVFVPSSDLGADYANTQAEAAGRTKECPGMIPPY